MNTAGHGCNQCTEHDMAISNLCRTHSHLVRRGPLLQIPSEKTKFSRNRLGSFSSSFKEKKEIVRQVFLFTNHILLTTRTSNGRLHLAKHYGKICLSDCTLIEDPSSEIFFFEEDAVDSNATLNSNTLSTLAPSSILSEKERVDYNGMDFRLVVDSNNDPPLTITLVSSSLHEKTAWCSDISQCIENLHYSDLLNSSLSEASSITMPQALRSDPKLFRDDVDIKFSRTLNSCKVPQIRHASVDRLLDRLTDLRFLSIDFLNTFLLTYRVFTTGHMLLDALRKVYKSHEDLVSDSSSTPHQHSSKRDAVSESLATAVPTGNFSPTFSVFVSGPLAENHYCSPVSCVKQEDTERDSDTPCAVTSIAELKVLVDECSNTSTLSVFSGQSRMKLAPIASCETLYDNKNLELPLIKTDDTSEPSGGLAAACSDSVQDADMSGGEDIELNSFVPIDNPKFCLSVSSETTIRTLAPLLQLDQSDLDSDLRHAQCLHVTPKRENKVSVQSSPKKCSESRVSKANYTIHALVLSPSSSPLHTDPRSASPTHLRHPSKHTAALKRASSPSCMTSPSSSSPRISPVLIQRVPSPICYSYSSPNVMMPKIKMNPFLGKRGSIEAESVSSPRSSFCQMESSPTRTKPASAVTSSHVSKRRVTWFCPDPGADAGGLTRGRSSSSAATTAFAAATAGLASCTNEHPKERRRFLSVCPGTLDVRPIKRRESVISTAATMRVLNVLKHWVSKHEQDFESNTELRAAITDLLEEMVCNSSLLPTEHKTAASILRTIYRDIVPDRRIDLEGLLQPTKTSSSDSFDTLSALDIAEQLTYLDHKIFVSMRSEELLNQAWMKTDKARNAPHVLLVSKRFNEVSRLVVSEIVGRINVAERVACIEKWAAIGDICRCLQNYNGVLQICAAFVNSSVYRLKKTWEKLSKQTKQMIDRLQTLVSSEGRFKNMRDALHRCDPPCIPYLGMYLTDLSFIEEGTPNFTDEKLVNFSKMRMIAHVIREIRLIQQTSYKIEHHPRITCYLLDLSRLYGDDQTYKASLDIEPKQTPLPIATNQS